ncbi:MAG TPA: RES family NAD+ phosphorylase [Candidatus Baltobacteraceae bacterium]|nr:RES family NAD+ phosphorylase [Candidatus Baltobacteraceae bacterium]
MIEVVRLVRAAFCADAASAFSGEGAALAGGRWNQKGTRAVYAASTRSLAALEILVHIDRFDVPADYVFASAQLDERDVVPVGDLPRDWRNPMRAAATVALGQSFLLEQSALALAVPSVVIPQERNYLINPAHPRFSALRIEPAVEPFAFDARLFAA